MFFVSFMFLPSGFISLKAHNSSFAINATINQWHEKYHIDLTLFTVMQKYIRLLRIKFFFSFMWPYPRSPGILISQTSGLAEFQLNPRQKTDALPLVYKNKRCFKNTRWNQKTESIHIDAPFFSLCDLNKFEKHEAYPQKILTVRTQNPRPHSSVFAKNEVMKEAFMYP